MLSHLDDSEHLEPIPDALDEIIVEDLISCYSYSDSWELKDALRKVIKHYTKYFDIAELRKQYRMNVSLIIFFSL